MAEKIDTEQLRTLYAAIKPDAFSLTGDHTSIRATERCLQFIPALLDEIDRLRKVNAEAAQMAWRQFTRHSEPYYNELE